MEKEKEYVIRLEFEGKEEIQWSVSQLRFFCHFHGQRFNWQRSGSHFVELRGSFSDVCLFKVDESRLEIEQEVQRKISLYTTQELHTWKWKRQREEDLKEFWKEGKRICLMFLITGAISVFLTPFPLALGDEIYLVLFISGAIYLFLNLFPY